jgi:hypothetical protein
MFYLRKFINTCYFKENNEIPLKRGYFPIAFGYWKIRLINFNAPIVTPWCPSGYLGYLLLKFEPHYDLQISVIDDL